MRDAVRAVALSISLCASGCWTNACIDGSRCSEELDWIWRDDGSDAGADSTCAGDERPYSSCKDEGYGHECDDGYWYREPCPDAGGGGGTQVQRHLLSVSRAGDGSGVVVSAPAAIDCGAICSVALVEGTRVTLTALPGSGAAFAGWSGDCGGAGACTVVMDGERSVSARFNAIASP